MRVADIPTERGLYRPEPVVRVAAIGDLHLRSRAPFDANLLADLGGRADLLVVAGDITDNGLIGEAEAAAGTLGELGIPVVAVLGNHDRRGLRRRGVRQSLERAGVAVLEGEATEIETASGARVGIAGVSGSGGGFWTPEDEQLPRMRAFRTVAVRLRREAERLDRALASLDTPVKIAVTHFAPTPATLGSEPPLKWWMLGNSELGRVIDAHGVDLVIHGHAHLGSPAGAMPGGAPVHNVALPVTGRVLVLDVPVRAAIPATAQ